jgi:hypothetical protein
MLLLTVIRYDTVSDYYVYVTGFYAIRNGYNFSFEKGYYILNQLFSFSQWGFIFVFAICALISYFGVYTMFKKCNIIFWGTISFILLGYINIFDNIIRQGVAMGFFAYSIKYAVKKTRFNFLKYCLINLLGVLFHTSAIITLLYFPLLILSRNIRINWILGVILILFSYLFFRYKILIKIMDILTFFVPSRYQAIFYDDDLRDFFLTESRGLSSMVISLLSCIPLYIYSETKDGTIRLIINISFFSSFLGMFFLTFWLIERIVYYLYIPRIISIALTLKYFFTVKRMPLFICIFSCLFFLHIRNVNNYYGYNNYYTIFNEKRENYIFYKRSYTRDKNKLDNFVDRSETTTLRP